MGRVEKCVCEKKKRELDRPRDRDYMCKHICNCVNVCVHALKTKAMQAVGGLKGCS